MEKESKGSVRRAAESQDDCLVPIRVPIVELVSLNQCSENICPVATSRRLFDLLEGGNALGLTIFSSKTAIVC